MISSKNASYNPLEINAEGTIMAILSMFNQRESPGISRWFCDACGMIHLGTAPLACDSCGYEQLTQQAETHREINSRW